MIQRTSNGKCYFYGNEISQEKYDEIVEIIKHKPIRDGYDYRLREDLTWEEYEIPPMLEPEPDADEILDILMGVTE